MQGQAITKHEFSAGQRAMQMSGPIGYRTGRAVLKIMTLVDYGGYLSCTTWQAIRFKDGLL